MTRCWIPARPRLSDPRLLPPARIIRRDRPGRDGQFPPQMDPQKRPDRGHRRRDQEIDADGTADRRGPEIHQHAVDRERQPEEGEEAEESGAVPPFEASAAGDADRPGGEEHGGQERDPGHERKKEERDEAGDHRRGERQRAGEKSDGSRRLRGPLPANARERGKQDRRERANGEDQHHDSGPMFEAVGGHGRRHLSQTSTRRFRPRPSSVSFEATESAAPKPETASGRTPSEPSSPATACARAWERRRLASALPSASANPKRMTRLPRFAGWLRLSSKRPMSRSALLSRRSLPLSN